METILQECFYLKDTFGSTTEGVRISRSREEGKKVSLLS